MRRYLSAIVALVALSLALGLYRAPATAAPADVGYRPAALDARGIMTVPQPTNTRSPSFPHAPAPRQL
jgi:hypothetical protein